MGAHIHTENHIYTHKRGLGVGGDKILSLEECKPTGRRVFCTTYTITIFALIYRGQNVKCLW